MNQLYKMFPIWGAANLSACVLAALPLTIEVSAASVSAETDETVVSDALETEVATVAEWFLTSHDLAENVDSPAVWHGSKGEHWLLSTTKSTHSLLVNDARNGGFIGRVGGKGPQLGQFNRPNGIAVIDDLLFVVERDNRRVQVLSLPELRGIGSFGSETLRKPYGLYVEKKSSEKFRVYVTDNYETESEEIPPERELGRRVALFEVEAEGVSAGTVEGELVGFIGETSGDGALRVVESIYGDPAHGRLLIAEEDDNHPTAGIKVYDSDGKYTGVIAGQGGFSGQAEGIALVATGGKSGYWIATDQGKRVNRFHVFDRESLEPLGSFQGLYTLNTDGVWFDPTPLPRFPEGAFYAVHNDGSVAAFAWHEVREALRLEN